MRLAIIAAAVGALLLPGVAAAQGWIEYVNREDHFTINFPGEPAIEEIEWISEDDLPLPTRQYSASRGDSTYKMVVIDYSDAQFTTMRGSIAHAATKYRRMGGEVTYDAYAQIDRIAGHQLQITQDNGRRMFVAIHLHDNRLYIAEAVVPPGAPPPSHFQAALQIIDDDGYRIRY